MKLSLFAPPFSDQGCFPIAAACKAVDAISLDLAVDIP